LKDPGAVALVLRLISDADALIEGFRPASPSAWDWVRCLFRTQSEVGVRTNDGLGNGPAGLKQQRAAISTTSQ
jgi:hypothetical protein